MNNKNNYKPSGIDHIRNIIMVAEFAYIARCAARGIENPIPFRTMMMGYAFIVMLFCVAIITMVIK